MRFLVGVLGILAVSMVATAKDGAAIDTSAGVHIAFDQLSGRQLDDRVEIRFIMSQKSWTAVQRAGIRPIMIAEVLSKDRRSIIGKAGVVQRTGRFFVTVPADHEAHSVRFALQHPQINGFISGGVGVGTVTARLGSSAVPTRQPQAAPKPQQVAKVAPTGDAMRACDRYGKETAVCRDLVSNGQRTRANVVVDCGGFGKGNRVQCLRHVSRTNVPMSGAVRACAGRFGSADARLECVRRAAVSRVEPASGVYACGAQFKDDGRALECVARIGYAAKSAQGLVDACSTAFGADKARLNCIGVGARSQNDLSSAVLACAQAMPWQNSRQQCIEAAAASKTDLASAIGACRSHASRPEVVLRCVRYAAQGGNPSMARAINGCGRAAGDETAFSSCVAQAASN